MKVVVVGTNQKDRERVAKVIKDRYSGLAEENAALLKKLERSNDAWIRGREEIADLEKVVKVFQDDTVARKAHIVHLEEQNAAIGRMKADHLAALAEKDKVAKTVEKMWLKRVTEYEAVIKSLKCKGLEICEIMKGQTRQIANLKEDFEVMARTAGLQVEQIAALKAEIDAWHSVFGTTQLTHAQARLEQAEEGRM